MPARVRRVDRGSQNGRQLLAVLYDLQSQERRVTLKMVDDHVDRVILLVADTHRNRRVIREFPEQLKARFPLGTAAVMRELRAGRLPERSGIVIR